MPSSPKASQWSTTSGHCITMKSKSKTTKPNKASKPTIAEVQHRVVQAIKSLEQSLEREKDGGLPEGVRAELKQMAAMVVEAMHHTEDVKGCLDLRPDTAGVLTQLDAVVHKLGAVQQALNRLVWPSNKPDSKS